MENKVGVTTDRRSEMGVEGFRQTKMSNGFRRIHRTFHTAQNQRVSMILQWMPHRRLQETRKVLWVL